MNQMVSLMQNLMQDIARRDDISTSGRTLAVHDSRIGAVDPSEYLRRNAAAGQRSLDQSEQFRAARRTWLAAETCTHERMGALRQAGRSEVEQERSTTTTGGVGPDPTGYAPQCGWSPASRTTGGASS